jgi:hypothetical protein
VGRAAAWATLPAVVALVACGTPEAELPGANDGTASAERSTLLDGREKSFVVVGHATSYAWPALLQDLLDDHAGGVRVYRVLNGAVGGAPVDRWNAEPGSADFEETLGALASDFFGPDARLRGAAPEPTVALCQQSLQSTRTPRGPVAAPDDAEGIRIGADALGTLVARLHDLGVERVYVATHAYKPTAEPEVGLERLALDALLERGHPFVFRGPDLWTPTRDAFPGAFAEDGVHLGEAGMKIMAEAWYRTLAGPEAREDVLARMHARSYDLESIMTGYLNWRRNGGSDPPAG